MSDRPARSVLSPIGTVHRLRSSYSVWTACGREARGWTRAPSWIDRHACEVCYS